MQMVRRALLALLLFLALAPSMVSGPAARANGPHATVLRVKGPVTPVMAMYLDRGISAAEQSGANAVVIQLDTPGGLDTAMRDIVQRIERATVPVAVYVAPAGARAASAGAFIVMAGNVAAMSPNTAIGAAHPVGGQGEEITGPMADKVTNDAVAYIRGIADLRARNAEWAESAVRQSVSAGPDEAVRLGVVDAVAPDLPALLAWIDGRTVQLPGGPVTVTTRNVALVQEDMNPIEAFLFAIADPTIAYLLLSLAMTGLFFELANPGSILPGIVGGIALLLALFALGTLPVNIAGLLLIFLAFLLFVADLWVTAGGMLTVGGAIAFTLGSFMLMGSNDPALRINPFVILAVAGAVSAFFGLGVAAAYRSVRRPVVRSGEELVGSIAVAQEALAPDGAVLVQGERWRARSLDGPIEEGERVRVASQDGLELRVRRLPVGYDDLLGSVGVAVSPLNPLGTVEVGGLPWDARVDGEPVKPGEHIRVTAVEGTALRVRRQG